MNLEHIRKRVRNGFRPFAIRLSDGRRVRVPHSEFIMVGRNVVAVLGKDDVVSTIDALHIVSIDDLPKAGRDSAQRR
jgi:hypothetical protein